MSDDMTHLPRDIRLVVEPVEGHASGLVWLDEADCGTAPNARPGKMLKATLQARANIRCDWVDIEVVRKHG